MKDANNYPNGVFCWVDLSTTDTEAAKTFYSDLFGWEIEDRPLPGGEFYTMMRLNGHAVAGLGPMPEEMQQQGIPSHWTSYVKHDDVDSVAEKVTAAGGTVIFPPMDVMEEGRMFMAVDPSGATFGAWQPGNHRGAQVVNAPNTLVWNELQTHNLEATRTFYNDVFGWDVVTDDNGYVMYKAEDRVQAGSMAIDASWGDVPSNWQVYFMVEDVNRVAERVKELGGSVIMGPMQAGEMGHFATCADPTGGVFTIMEFSGPVDPPPWS